MVQQNLGLTVASQISKRITQGAVLKLYPPSMQDSESCNWHINITSADNNYTHYQEGYKRVLGLRELRSGFSQLQAITAGRYYI